MYYILPHELSLSANLPTDPKIGMPTDKIEFKLGTIVHNFTQLHAADQKAVNEIKINPFEEIKTLNIHLHSQKNLTKRIWIDWGVYTRRIQAQKKQIQ